MRALIVRYKTTEAHAATNETLVHAVYDQLRDRKLGGFHYATFRLADGVSFLHFAIAEGAEPNPLSGLPAFQEFQRQLQGRCVEPPVVTELSVVDAYEVAGLSGAKASI